MRNRARFLVPLLAAGMVAAGCTSGGPAPAGQGATASAPAGGQAADPNSLPRNETLYTSGTQWGPPANFNPIREWDSATGTKGLAYETLFHYDPNAAKLVPWLAESGTWVDDKTYEVRLRQGVTWSDKQPLTAKDVVYTFELGKMKTIPYANLWDWLTSVEAVDDRTVKFSFSKANYQQWDFNLYSRSIVPQHIWNGRSEEDVLNGVNENPVGTGSYTYMSHDQDRVVWKKRDDWWGKAALNMDPKPRYIVDIVNSSNEVAMGLLLQKGLDMSNNFLPGAANLVKGNFGISTYYPEPPYMLSANTAWLVPNTTKKPMDDAEFRKALAYSVDTKKIVEGVYGNLVKAADPTGLLPQWDAYIDKTVTAEHGFSFDTAKAKKLLADAGYRDRDGDGLVENKDGSKINLKLIVPSGWTDWMEAIRVIAASAKESGINITPDFPDFNALVETRGSGKFDLVINNERQLSNTPWTYFDYVFQLPIRKTQNTVNFGRYENKEAWDLVQKLDQVKADDAEGMKAVTSQIEKIQLQEMPIIPLWYNGLWSQVSGTVWKNWPSSAAGTPKAAPAMWRNWLELGGFETVAQLQPVTP
ncbi:ABC transporter substrate-binding protein [Sphaerisporangium sp. TRM90804]|uniref:ABC transporter substrate-binding protein n=1 Tax=Sphaerisporangium sp. TRM90804 TaxID=3031113 RepID=UPI00244C8567|nr:ABC transporter substrate-binding protein [Sphaerisporangium sp. TRM90804]MDH2426680.1 ABC transporter substrate-binding protein [Sphaerisporangium sp. TRM90804]